jgi:hypothetical protein
LGLKYIKRIRQTIPKDASFLEWDTEINELVDSGWEITAASIELDDDSNFDTVISLVKDVAEKNSRISSCNNSTLNSIIEMLEKMKENG